MENNMGTVFTEGVAEGYCFFLRLRFRGSGLKYTCLTVPQPNPSGMGKRLSRPLNMLRCTYIP